MSLDPCEAKILIVDDEEAMRMFLTATLERVGYMVESAEDGEAGLFKLEQANQKGKPYHLAIIDLQMPRLTGMDLLPQIKERWPRTTVVVLTAHGSIPVAVEAMKLGADDFLTKPIPSPDHLRQLVARILDERFSPEETHRLAKNESFEGSVGTPVSTGDPTKKALPSLADEQRKNTRSTTSDFPEHHLVAYDPLTKAVLEKARLVAQSDTTVLLTGESGTGKEMFARFIHEQSPWSSGPFVAVNCAALPASLLESELFGHEKGAFTGAVNRKIGRFEQASGGSLFLDEIGELELNLQAKFLRVLQEKVFERIGGNQLIRANVRIIAATNKDLAAAVQEHQFRSDLFYRLSVFPIELPALRKRPGDILPLAQRLLAQAADKLGRDLPRFTEEALRTLMAYSWPGNVRELANAIERAVILSMGNPIRPVDFGLNLSQNPSHALAALDGDSGASLPVEGLLKQQQRDTILRVLAENGYNRQKTAQQLGISIRTLRNKLKEYNQPDLPD